jgi:hypothetical protein
MGSAAPARACARWSPRTERSGIAAHIRAPGETCARTARSGQPRANDRRLSTSSSPRPQCGGSAPRARDMHGGTASRRSRHASSERGADQMPPRRRVQARRAPVDQMSRRRQTTARDLATRGTRERAPRRLDSAESGGGQRQVTSSFHPCCMLQDAQPRSSRWAAAGEKPALPRTVHPASCVHVLCSVAPAGLAQKPLVQPRAAGGRRGAQRAVGMDPLARRSGPAAAKPSRSDRQSPRSGCDRETGARSPVGCGGVLPRGRSASEEATGRRARGWWCCYPAVSRSLRRAERARDTLRARSGERAPPRSRTWMVARGGRSARRRPPPPSRPTRACTAAPHPRRDGRPAGR